jgi:hypothetical protein
VTAPPPPRGSAATPLKLRDLRAGAGHDASTIGPGWERDRMTVEVELVPPAGTPTANRTRWRRSPLRRRWATSIRHHLRRVGDDGRRGVCDSRCNYSWDFGDFTTDNGKRVTHKFTLPGPTRSR